jgi:transposase InsO family protein
VKYACIDRHQGEFPVRLMCRVLSVCASGFYAWRKRTPSERAQQDQRLLLAVRVAHERSGETYGAPRVHRELKEEGTRVGKKRVARLMREDGLVARLPRRYVHTTDSNHTHPIAPNLLDRRFDVSGGELDRVWVSDITYVPTREGWLYLATVLDLGSRRCIGWAMHETLEADLTISALRMAIAARNPQPGLVHHSDRGSQYACKGYRDLLDAHAMIATMSRKGNCWDNAVAESFFATIEFELIMKHDWRTREEASRTISRYLEIWYNRQRRHSTLGYVSPAEYERRLQQAA